MLTDPRFCLSNGVTQRFGMGPMPKTVRLNREGFAVDAGIKKKTLVYPYMHLATHPAPGKGDLFSPIYGVVTDITERSVFVDAVEPDEELKKLGASVEKLDLLSREERGEELVPVLKGLGVNTKTLGQK